MRYQRAVLGASLVLTAIGVGPNAHASMAPSELVPAVQCSSGRIDIASADVARLSSLPGLSHGVAKKIRSSLDRAPIADVDELVSRKLLNAGALIELLSADPCLSTGDDPRIAYHDHLSCTAAGSVDLNTAAVAQLGVLPGLRNAAALVSSRPLSVTVAAAQKYSNAATRAVANAFANESICLSSGPFTSDDGSAIMWVNPGDPFTVQNAGRTMSGEAGAVSDGCWATITPLATAPAVPAPPALPDDAAPVEGATAVATDFHIDCGVASSVTLSWIESSLVGDVGGDVVVGHLRSEGWEGVPGTVAAQTGLVTVEVSDLSPFSWVIRRFGGGDLTNDEVNLCSGLTNWAKCLNVKRVGQPWIDSQVNARFGAGATNRDDDRGNAYKHCILMGLVTYWYGASFAKELGDAHEARDGNDALSKSMDLHNNEQGRRYAQLYIRWEQQCYDAAFDGRLKMIVRTPIRELVNTDWTAPPPPPPPPGGSLSVAFSENPFRCDNATRTFGTVSGATPGETLSFWSPQLGALLSGSANAQGALSIIWTCSPGEAGGSWIVTATGQTSGRTVTFTVTGA